MRHDVTAGLHDGHGSRLPSGVVVRLAVVTLALAAVLIPAAPATAAAVETTVAASANLRSKPGGAVTGSLGPETHELALANTIGTSGIGMPVSSAWSR